ncbi:hypothetical protein FRC12_021169 [Ceratobasidium sp. 428]|nr:hypothetical protein FRC12_021169 [Ceratobasidium sp. 428]
MKTQITSVLGALSCFAFFAGPVRSQAAFEVLLLRNPANRNCRLVHIDKYSYRSTARFGTEITPVHCIAEFGDDSCYSEQISVIGQTSVDVWEKVGKECSGLDKSDDPKKYLDAFQLPLNPGWNEDSQQSSGQDLVPAIELHPLPGLATGSSSNRVDIVFFSDGYTAKEKDRFFDDATRLGIAITVNQTYAPVAPLLNFWGAFTPSVDSGIGVGGKPKNTVYGLYRDGTELRGVYTSKPEVASAACKSLGSGCNYPLLLGNDPLYGGLGGEFTISTASVLNGPLVLRHELGHSIIWIGDEYDGSIYFGPNAAELAHNKSISWAHWLSEPTGSDAPPRAERNAVPLLAYPWTMLNITKAWSTTFTSDGTFSYVLLRYSLSAVPDAKALEIKLDGETISWEAKPGVGLDRWFYDVWVNEKKSGLRNGTHELSFALQEGGKERLAQLCSVEVIEYGNKNE